MPMTTLVVKTGREMPVVKDCYFWNRPEPGEIDPHDFGLPYTNLFDLDDGSGPLIAAIHFGCVWARPSLPSLSPADFFKLVYREPPQDFTGGWTPDTKEPKA